MVYSPFCWPGGPIRAFCVDSGFMLKIKKDLAAPRLSLTAGLFPSLSQITGFPIRANPFRICHTLGLLVKLLEFVILSFLERFDIIPFLDYCVRGSVDLFTHFVLIQDLR